MATSNLHSIAFPWVGGCACGGTVFLNTVMKENENNGKQFLSCQLCKSFMWFHHWRGDKLKAKSPPMFQGVPPVPPTSPTNGINEEMFMLKMKDLQEQLLKIGDSQLEHSKAIAQLQVQVGEMTDQLDCHDKDIQLLAQQKNKLQRNR